MSSEPDRPFDEPWQARAFALAEILFEDGAIDREDFRQALINAIGEDPARPYWESWLAALEGIVAQELV